MDMWTESKKEFDEKKAAWEKRMRIVDGEGRVPVRYAGGCSRTATCLDCIHYTPSVDPYTLEPTKEYGTCMGCDKTGRMAVHYYSAKVCPYACYVVEWSKKKEIEENKEKE